MSCRELSGQEIALLSTVVSAQHDVTSLAVALQLDTDTVAQLVESLRADGSGEEAQSIRCTALMFAPTSYARRSL
jgi:hypothetical protein